MRRRKLRTIFMSLLTVLCSAFVVNAGQDSKVLAAENVFEMTQGGSIRIIEPYGLRFQVKMSADIKEKADKVGMLIFPADYLVDNGTNGDVYYESVEKLAKTNVSSHRIDLDLTSKLYEKDGYWLGNGAIVNIKDKNMSREFTGVAYYVADGETVWADTTQLVNTTRSASKVALMTHTDETNAYSSDTDKLLLDYVDYIKSTDLKDVQIGTIPLFVDNGADTAKSYWKAEYVDGGVKVTVDVKDTISVDSSNRGYSDNIELQMQAVDNLWQTTNYTFNFLCDASGRYWARRYVENSYTNITLENDPTVKNNELYYVFNTTEDGYQVEVFVSYGILNVTEEEAKGNVRICPMLRNRADVSKNVYECSSLLGCDYHLPTTWFVLTENNVFTRTDLVEFTLASRNESATELIANLATLQAEDGDRMAKTKLGAHAVAGKTWSLDGIARDLIGTDFLFADLTGKATVSEEGNVIICVKEMNTTLIDTLKANDWTLVADKCRTALGISAGVNSVFRAESAYYAKYCKVGEIIETSGEYSILFGKASDDTAESVYQTTPAYHSFEAIQDSFYSEEENEQSNCPSIAVTKGGRLYAGYGTGGECEPREENCGIIQYSDDGGKTWTPLFVIDTWNDQVVGGTKQAVCHDIELNVDPETNIIYISYVLRYNDSLGQVMDLPTWMFTISNPDSDEMTEEALEISEHWNTNLGFVRNGFIILKNGNFLVVPNGVIHSEQNDVFISTDKGKTWNVIGSAYIPQATNFDEPIFIEKDDGSLWCTARTTRGYVYESFSYDGGKTWTTGKATNIKNPSSRFDIERLQSGKLIMVYSDQSVYRIGMVVAISEDDGETWDNKLCLYDGFASYPSISLDYTSGEEVIHVVFDDGRYYRNQWRTSEREGKKYHDFAYIYHVALTEDEIMAGGDSSKEKTELLAVGDSYTHPNWWLGFEGSFGTYGGESIGIGGTKVADWNTEARIAEIVAKNPENLFINLGINDIGVGTDGKTVGNALVAYLEALKTALPNTEIYYNMIVYPSNTDFSYDAINASNSLVEAYIDGNAEDNVNKIDIREKLMQMGEADTRRFTDGLHLTAESYAILCEEIKNVTGIGRKVESLDVITHMSKHVYSYMWTDWEDCAIQSDAPKRYKVRGHAADEGLYINAVQYVDNIVKEGHEWNERTHLEAQITQHNIGKGADCGFTTPTYAAFWLDGTSYLNSYTNVGTVKNHVTITDRGEDYAGGYRYEICYEIFIPFANNVGNPDGPYAYIQFKHHMPGETEEGFEYANREFRDNARYLWQDNCKSYEFRANGIVGKDLDYKNLGTISGTGVATWDLNVHRAPNAFYAKITTTDTIDSTVRTGVNLWMNFGEYTTKRTENTYVFDIATLNGNAVCNMVHYPNETYTQVQLPNVGYATTSSGGTTTLYLMLPYDSLDTSLDVEEISISFRSVRGSTTADWTYSGCKVAWNQPFKYLTITADNEVYLLGEKAIQAGLKANNVLKTGYEDVFVNLATISADSGVLSTITNEGKMYDDRKYYFETSEAKFIEGKTFVYTGFAEGAFTVEESGYVFLLASGNSAYNTVRTNIEKAGWKKQFTNWNYMGAMTGDPICYYAKWCEAGESYSYGKWSIPIGDASSVE